MLSSRMVSGKAHSSDVSVVKPTRSTWLNGRHHFDGHDYKDTEKQNLTKSSYP